jgi:hypothetical protein
MEPCEHKEFCTFVSLPWKSFGTSFVEVTFFFSKENLKKDLALHRVSFGLLLSFYGWI